MLRATLRMDRAAASAAVPAIAPEAGRELPRTQVSVQRDGDCAEVTITASDTAAMRAALNSYLECIKVTEDISRLIGVRP